MSADNTLTPMMNVMPMITPLGASRHELNPAEWMYERVVRQIVEFEKSLSADEEIAGRLVAAPDASVFHIEDLSYWGPDMIIFYGSNMAGRPVQLVQHYTQLNVLLTALPKIAAEPRRIGFALGKKLEPTK